ncbi:hypothetical protein BD779DRAFT_1512824 [Infundibulicybe gibba]|nr:hypothetical protein BD779DRAFT_1512824 [Infundibulicybe gibba]
MPEGVFGQKRTRSQLTLPDEILQVPQGSPLKDARNAARSRSATTRDHPADSVVGGDRGRATFIAAKESVCWRCQSKRSASPQRNEYSTTSDSPTAGRELKRVKRDIFGLESNGGPTTRRAATLRSARTHFRNFSGSSLQDTKRSSSELPFSKPHSSNIAPFSLPQPDVKKGRAQSVPLFSTSSDVLHLDLRNPPPSPIRMRSTSTERDPLLRIISRQGVAPATLAPTSDNRSVTAIPIVVHLELPETPHHRSNLFPLPMSPLTPLPETPQPSKVKPSTLKHQPIVGGTMDSLKATQIVNAIGPTLTSHDSVIPTIPTSGHNLPEPTMSRALVPPSPSPAAASGSMAPNIGTKMVRAKPLPASRNAFNVLMSNAQSSKTLGKGKGKAITPNHVGPKIGGPNFSRTQKASMIEGSKPRGDNQQKPSVKAKMKPREKPKPKPVPVPVPAAAIIERADESDRMAPQQQAHSPAFSSVEVPIIPSREIRSSEEPATQIEAEPQMRHTADDTQGSVPQPQSQPPPIPESKSQARVEPFLNSAKPQPVPPGEQAGAQQRIARIPRNPKRIIARPPVGRVTRSASGKGKGEDIGEMKQANINGIPTSSSKPIIPITAASGADELKPDNVYTDFSTSNSSLTDLTDSGPEINPGSPMRISSPARLEKDAPHKPASTSVVTPTTPKMLSKFRSPSKPMSSPSPTKLVRSSSMFATRPTAAPGSGASILSTLSNALEKLSMPPPPRPNTSMGFNRNLDDEDNDEDNASIKFGAGAKDDVSFGQRIFGSSTGAQRAATLGSSSLADRPITTGNVAKRSSYISRPILPDTTRLRTGNGLIMQGGKFLVDSGGRSRIFGTGSLMGRSGGKASKKSSLPSVMASPVKGGATDSNANTNIDPADSGYTADQPNTLSLNSTSSAGASFNESESEDKAARQSIWRRDTARRISLATASLSQSLNSLPPNPPNPLGFLGPPAFPVGLGHATAPSNPPLAGPSSRLPTATRAGVKTRSATTIPKTGDGTIGHAPMKTNSTATAQTLKILDECVIFVDVRSDDGEEAGSLFTEMLEGVGAKILTRVGKTCTHIVYKNGLMSTLNRYRLLQDPKPLVVGIGWVVECVEKRARVDESRFQVDLEGVNVAGTNKVAHNSVPRREHARDMHPLDRSSSCKQPLPLGKSLLNLATAITLDDNLPPLEKARRRKSMLIGPRT